MLDYTIVVYFMSPCGVFQPTCLSLEKDLICVHTSNLKLATIGVLTPQRGANEKSQSAIHWLLFSREPALKAYHKSQMIFILCENLGNWFLLKESMRDLKAVAPHYWRYPCTRHGSSLDSWTVIITGRDWNEPRVSILVPCLKPKKKGDVRVSNSVDSLRLLTFERRKKIILSEICVWKWEEFWHSLLRKRPGIIRLYPRHVWRKFSMVLYSALI